ncbi:Major Facilitator Superfamily protein [Arthrobacter ulcerisalmonis]|uniref:Major Facilitator Superfamily protein n=1 Tax=Arthrobacter ulcerisalmonis TaxID=2483813 RepID=A0A3P5WMM2_9MICC|nr:MFS transporter [Arthrobacter ulcerisalmonis]VDC20851.1 Major Facilitator Superfamily protein [Arthrobacter ulcerisalmonis]
MSPPRWRVALSAQAILAQAAWVGIRLIIGYRALSLGADPVFLGLLASSFALPALLAAFPAGRLADRLGGTAMAFTGLLLAIAGTALMLVVPGLPILLLASAVIGLGHLMVMVGQQAFVAHASDAGTRDGAFGTLTAAASIGQLVGPPAVTLVAVVGLPADSPPDTTLGLLVCLTFSVLATPAFLFLRHVDATLRRDRRRVAAPQASAATVLRTPGLWRSLVVSGAVLVTVDLMYAFVPVWAAEQNVSAPIVGLLLAVRAAVSVASRFGLTRLIAIFGRKAMLMVSIAAAALALTALPLVGAAGALAVMIGLGIGLGIPQPLTMAWVVALTSSSSHGAVLGLRMSVNRLAQVTLPVAVGAVAAPLGVLGIFWANAALLLGAVVVVAGSDAGGRPTQQPEPDQPS